MRLYLVLCLLLSLWFAGAEEECRLMARFREENHPNGTISKARNYDNVEIFWRFCLSHDVLYVHFDDFIYVILLIAAMRMIS